MNPALIKTLLESSLPVRLALLDAEPTGAGWLVPAGASEAGNCYVAMRVTPYERGQVRDGAAWLPCNPLAIVEHARALYGYTARVRVDQPDYDEWRCSLVVPAAIRRQIRGAKTKTKMNRCPHTAAVALLREVVG